VETVKAELESNKLTVVGNVDPTKLRDKLAQKAKKNVELLSPQPKKDNKADDKSDQKPEKTADDKKPKEVLHWSPLACAPFLFFPFFLILTTCAPVLLVVLYFNN
jgi:hypothetical protein